MSSLPSECRLIVDPPGRGAWNMAVDEALLESAAERGACSLRFYQWAEPTLSLGYFQSAADRDGHAPSRHCPLVRRQSGGGAIVHDAEITYSFTAPARSPLAVDATNLYRAIHGALIKALASRGIEATICEIPPAALTCDEPFLCFQRRAPGDVLVDDTKIAGSAQRRRRGALLQHGSVLLRASPAAPELPGLLDAATCQVDETELLAQWQAHLAGSLGLELVTRALGEAEIQRASELDAEKYVTEGWTYRR